MGVATSLELGTVLVDTREKRPYRIEGAVKATLEVGDYSLAGFEDCIAVERKSFDDLYNCLTARRSEFWRQLQRLGAYRHCGLLVDAPLSSLLMGHFRCKLPGREAVKRLLAMAAKAGVPVWFADKHGATLAVLLLAGFMQQEQRPNGGNHDG